MCHVYIPVGREYYTTAKSTLSITYNQILFNNNGQQVHSLWVERSLLSTTIAFFWV